MADVDDDGGTADGGEDTIGSEDIAWLNGRAVERAGAFTRLAGTALIVVGAIGVATWLWLTVRQLHAIDDADSFGSGDFGTGTSDFSFADRLDLVANFVPVLLYAAVAAGVGSALRLVADYTVARTDGSISGFAVGDPVPAGGLADDHNPVEVDPFA